MLETLDIYPDRREQRQRRFPSSGACKQHYAYCYLKAGIVATGGASDLSYTFSIPQDISVPVTEYDGVNPRYAAFNEVEIYEGSFIKNNFTVDTSVPDQKFVLPNSDIDTSTLVVKVRDTENDTIATTYNKVDTIVGVSTNVYAYFYRKLQEKSMN